MKIVNRFNEVTNADSIEIKYGVVIITAGTKETIEDVQTLCGCTIYDDQTYDNMVGQGT